MACLSPLGAHKDHMSTSDLAEETGSEIDCLHRPLSPFSSFQGGSPHTSSTHDHCTANENIGFSINKQKSILIPCREIEFLGVILQSYPQFFVYPAQTAKAKIQGPAATTQGCLSSDHYSDGFSPIYWAVSVVAMVIPPGALFYRSLQAFIHHSQKQKGD